MVQEIQPKEVTGVLLQDGWHEVEEGSFNPDSSAFPGGNGTRGFSFTDVDYCDGGRQIIITRLSGPLSSIRAVRA